MCVGMSISHWNLQMIVASVIAGAWLILSVIVAKKALSYGRSKAGWFALAVLFTPLVAFVFLSVAGVPKTSDPPVDQEDQPEPLISDAEYKVLREWYEGWARACRLLATFAFSAIFFTIVVFDVKPGHQLNEAEVNWIRSGWLLLAAGGALTGISVLLAYVWFDAVCRHKTPRLVGKIFYACGPEQLLRIGRVAWIVTTVGIVAILAGLVCVVRAALLVLEEGQGTWIWLW